MKRTAVQRKNAEAAGRRAELVAGCLLRLKGFTILARRFKTPVGEIDLVAKRGRRLIFVEVKARQTIEDALYAVTGQAERRISAAADMFLARHPSLAEYDMRYDIIAVAGWRMRHVADAWRDNEWA